MDVYMFQAALFCVECATEAMEIVIRPKGVEGTDWDSNDYPVGPYSDGGGEADMPQFCDNCGVFLENPLTGEGCRAVANMVEEAAYRMDDGYRVAGHRQGTVAELSEFYDMPFPAGEPYEWNRWDILEAWWLYCCDYHSGMGSKEYRALSVMDRMRFHVGAGLDLWTDLTDNGREIYAKLVRSRGTAIRER